MWAHTAGKNKRIGLLWGKIMYPSLAVGIGIEKKNTITLFDWHKYPRGIWVSQAECGEGLVWVSWAQADAGEQ